MDNKDNLLLKTITQILLVAITTGVIVFSMTNKVGQHYPYEEGKPWEHKTLIADYNFDIMKSDSAIEREKEQIQEEHIPYFVRDDSIGEKAIEDLKIAVRNDTTGILSNYGNLLERRLHFLYERGIISDPEYRRYLSSGNNTIKVSSGKSSFQIAVSEEWTLKQSYNQIFFDNELAVHRDDLMKFNLNELIKPNIIYDQKLNDEILNEAYSNIAKSIGHVAKNEKIVDRGEKVDHLTAMKIESLFQKQQDNRKDKNETANARLGYILYVLTFISLFSIFLVYYRKDYYDKPRNILLLYFLIAIVPVIVSLMKHNIMTLSVYIIPFAIVPIIIRVFLDSRTAFMTHTTIVMISSLNVNYRYEFIIIQMAAGIAAIYALSDMSKRAHLFKAVLAATFSAFVIHYAMTLIQERQLIPEDTSTFTYLTISGVLMLLAYPMMFFIEKLFGFISSITYLELSDTNQELLRMLSERAPGTFVHSTTVSNLAAEIAKRIGADVLLVRTGALYHDIGKLENPVFFTENQAGVNPHTKLTEKESAAIIIDHVRNGQRLAEKYNLPHSIIDFILTHHGKGVTKYFYVKYKNEHPDEKVDASVFSYKGPNPQTREQAILMMADTVEAATKSLDFYNDEIISQRVNELIDQQVKEGYFAECPITFRDIQEAKLVLIDRLKSIYHTRIKYPTDKSAENERQNAERKADNYNRRKKGKKR